MKYLRTTWHAVTRWIGRLSATPPLWLEIALVVSSVGWGLLVLLQQPYDVSTSRSYDVLRAWIPDQNVLGCGFALTGVLRLVASVVGRPLFQVVISFIGALGWVLVSAGFIAANARTTSPALFGTAALSSLIIMGYYIWQLDYSRPALWLKVRWRSHKADAERAHNEV